MSAEVNASPERPPAPLSEDVPMQECDDAVPIPTEAISMADVMKKELDKVTIERTELLLKFVKQKEALRKATKELDQDANVDPEERDKILSNHNAQIDATFRKINTVNRDLDPAYHHWKEFCPREPVDMSWRGRSETPMSTPTPTTTTPSVETTGAYAIPFNNSNLYHIDIRRLKEKAVPVFKDSEKIDFSRVIPINIDDEPELKLNFQASTDAMEIVRAGIFWALTYNMTIETRRRIFMFCPCTPLIRECEGGLLLN
ncbi:hypothetical protein EMPS_10617 [Entomortierella parvispora]|uniref:Uncharacterized protein n=1 Tax=Entomortierella parvispora TaxID=205924 RepID=A0A9P3HKX5_9FUNG|nr:hypothetical protein EMPS_10617 [Entomortierella parvispora]